MAKKLNLSTEQQGEIVNHVSDTFQYYKTLSETYRGRMQDVYDELNTFEEPKEDREKRQTWFKVNKAHEIKQKAKSKIFARPFKWLVTKRPEAFGDKSENVEQYVQAIQDYLTNSFDRGDFMEIADMRLDAGLSYGNSFAKTHYRYDVVRSQTPVTRTEVDEEGNEIEVNDVEITAKVASETPTIEVKSRTEMYYNPRYTRLEDFPSIIDVSKEIRLGYILNRKSKFMNIDKLLAIADAELEEDMDTYKKTLSQISGIPYDKNDKIDPNKLEVKCYYGYYDLWDSHWKDEKIYEFWTVEDTIVIYAQEILFIPFEDFRVFPKNENYYATGLVEPMLGLQKELNRKKNKGSEYIDQALYRSYVRSPNSGINPSSLSGRPWNIIATSNSVDDAMRNFVEIPHRKLPAAYFQEQNDFERQIQGVSFSIDVSQPVSQQGLTNTATGARIQQFEINSVASYIRRKFERAMERLAYKFLMITVESLGESENLVIQKSGNEGYWKIHKEAMKDAILKYHIKVESGSSAFDSLDQRRDNAIAQSNIAFQFGKAWVPVNYEQLFRDTMSTFEGIDPNKLIKPQSPLDALQQPQNQANPWSIKKQQDKQDTNPATAGLE